MKHRYEWFVLAPAMLVNVGLMAINLLLGTPWLLPVNVLALGLLGAAWLVRRDRLSRR